MIPCYIIVPYYHSSEVLELEVSFESNGDESVVVTPAVSANQRIELLQ